MTVRLAPPFVLKEVKKDETKKIKVVVKPTPAEIILRLEIDPAEAEHANDWFSLRSTDGSYEQHHKIKDDMTPGDKFVDLLFTGVDAALSYSMEVDSRPNGKKHFLFENVEYSKLTVINPPPEPEKPAGEGELRIRLEIDPAESPDDVFVLKGGSYEQKKTVKDDQVAGDKFVDLLFTGLPRDQSFTLEVNGEALFHDVPYEELAHQSAEHAPEGHDAGTGDFKVRLEIDPADAREADDKFVLKGAHGFEKTLTIKDDQVPGDKFVDLHFEGIPRGESLTLEIHDSNGQHVMFENVPYGELAHVSAEHAPPGHDAGAGDFKIRIDADPADVKEAGDKFILRGKGGFEKTLTLKDDQVPGDKCVDLDFKGLPVNESYTLEIDDGKGKHVIFEDVPYDELAHLSGDGVEPEIRIHDWIDENANAPESSES